MNPILGTARKISNSTPLRVTVNCILLIIGALTLLSNLPYMTLPFDEVWQAVSVKYYRHSPLAMGSFWLGHVWCGLVGYNLFNLALLSRIAMAIAIGSATVYLYARTRNSLLAGFVFMTTCLIATLDAMNLFNWDSMNYMTACWAAIALLEYLRKPTTLRACIAGILFGLCIIMRLPMLFSLPILTVAVIYAKKIIKSSAAAIVRDILLSAGAALLTWIIAGALMAGSLSGYIDAFNPDNIISGHGLNNIPRYIYRFNQYFPSVLISWTLIPICYLFSVWIGDSDKIRPAKIIAAIITTILLGWAIIRNEIVNGVSGMCLFSIGLPLVIILCILIPFRHRTEIPADIRYSGLLLVALYLSIGIGSDTIFQRWSSLFAIPLSMGLIWNYLPAKQKKIITYCIILIAISFSVICAYRLRVFQSTYSAPENVTEFCKNRLMDSELKENYDIAYSINDRIAKEGKVLVNWDLLRYFMMEQFESTPLFTTQIFHFGNIDPEPYIKRISNPEYVLCDNPDLVDKFEKLGFSQVEQQGNYYLLRNKLTK